MRLGILSDTHDRLALIERAVRVFNEEEVDLVIHVGDYCAPFSLSPLGDLGMDWMGVLGNNDGEIPGLLQASGGRIKTGALSLELGGKRILADHINPFRASLAASGDFDLILFGHTHEREVFEEKGCLCVNPGEVCGYLTQQATVACVELEHLRPDAVKIIQLAT